MKKVKRGRGRPKGSLGKASKVKEGIFNPKYQEDEFKFEPKFMDTILENGTEVQFKFAGAIKEGKIIGRETLYDDRKVYIIESSNTLKYPVRKDQIIDKI